MKKTILKLNKWFYTLKSITETVKAFEKIADIEILKENEHNVIIFKNIKDVKIEDLRGEFSNYCLMLNKKEIKHHNFWRYNREKI